MISVTLPVPVDALDELQRAVTDAVTIELQRTGRHYGGVKVTVSDEGVVSVHFDSLSLKPDETHVGPDLASVHEAAERAVMAFASSGKGWTPTSSGDGGD